jgi:CubicO group peptidase (beta-lactamase class C family)
VVERLTGLSLQEYMKTYIWEPLGIRDMTFFLSTCPDMQAKVAHMTRRLRNDDPTDPEERLVYSPLQPVLAPDVQDCLGGGGIFTSPRELFKVIHAVLLASGPEAVDDGEIPPGQLLRRSTVQAMFRPQLREAGRGALQKVASIPRLNRMMGDMPVSTRKDWGLGGLLIMEDLPGRRRKGTMSWGGNPNMSWVSPAYLLLPSASMPSYGLITVANDASPLQFIDPTAGLCGLYASQLMPLGDAKSVELMQLFEREMYARLAASDAE